ncbi:hypothetical protein [Orenia marismortui]|uniref:Uncharacterized protein n=1 Tax=Orenia marismortui TaxID=46469 RepID=A0A4R8H0R4_9FIRM|nr:hypothetical protein [Orenia marismortui]TDX51504.1 hypothetical protein C7959_1124 [Orenia marismortui]
MVLLTSIFLISVFSLSSITPASAQSRAIKVSNENCTAGRLSEDKVIKILKGETKGDIKEAKEKIINTTLKKLNLEEWLKTPPLEHKIIFGDIHPNQGEELIVAISMGKDNGILAVFSKQDDKLYQITETLDDLVPITSLSLTNLPNSKYQSLVIEEYLDERIGGFFEIKITSIYNFNKKKFNKVWERKNYLKEARPCKDKGVKWLIHLEKVDISLISQGKIEVSGINKYWKSKNLDSTAKEEQVIKSNPVKETYIWDEAKSKFKEIS